MTHLTGNAEPAASEEGQSLEVESSWTDSLSDDYKEHQSLSTFKSIDDLAKSYIHAQGMIGKDKVIVPTDSSTPEEVSEFYSKLGMPAPEEYSVEGADDALRDVLLSNHVLPKQAKAIVDALAEMNKGSEEAGDSEYDEAMQQELEELKEEWGESFDGNIQRAAHAFKVFGNEDTANYLNETGLGNDPVLLKLFSNIGAKLGEDSFKGTAQPSMNKDAAKARINTLYADTAGPLYDKSSAKHNDVLKELQALTAIANS